MTDIAVASIAPFHRRISDKTVWSFVRVLADDGTEGWGEATINGAVPALDAETRRQHAVLAGATLRPAGGVAPLGGGKLGWAVASAIDQALWDIAARRAALPLARLLSPACRAGVALYANINRGTLDRSPDGFAATAGAAVAAGFRAIKMAPFDGLTPETCGTQRGRVLIEAGLARIAAAHAAIAGAAELMVDCHWRFTPQAAAETLAEAARIGIAWFECPLPETDDNIAEVRRLRTRANAAGVRLAGMEEASTLAAFLPWAEAYDVMMPDVKYAGGLAETLRIVEALSSRGVAVSLHNPTGSVCHAVSLHVTAALPPGLPLEMQWGETDLLFDLPTSPLPRPAAGHAALPAGIGHGARLDPADLAARADGLNGLPLRG